MCGICGYSGLADRELIKRMTAVLGHRGPDDHGFYQDGDVNLGHRRLSIIDLASGHQPMANADGSLVIVFNGEIYNFPELRTALMADGHRFTTSSDTEVLLRLYEVYGPAALSRLNGMFAFAIYDKRKMELFLARDRIGIKPLYYLDLPNRFLFASETKALLCYREWSRDIDPRAIDGYLALRYVPGNTGLFKAVKRLPPGHFLVYKDGKTQVKRYWRPPTHEGAYDLSDQEYFEEFSELMERSVRRRLITDVSFGAYLSGGLDSSVIVALMSRLGSAPVKTFSVGFDYEHDELNQAADTARLLGCDHHVVQCRPRDVELLPEIVYHSDEPLGDPITIPMFQLAREAKKQVTVILTGEGGDEILAGYLFHKVISAAQTYRRLIPAVLRRRLVQPLLSLTPPAILNHAFRYPAYLGDRGKLKALDYHAMLDRGTMDEQYRHLISLFDSRDTGALYTSDFRSQVEETIPLGLRQENDTGSKFDQMLRLQFEHWLPDNMLLRQDKMSMASAIEGRVPFLDHELVEFAFRLPRNLRLRHFVGKYILRRFAKELLPRETADRRKMPFYVPIENYFEQPEFVDMMNDLLSENSVRQRGMFRPEAVAKLRDSMRRKEFIFVKQVFSLMTLELWFRIFVDNSIRGAPVENASVSVAH